MLVICRSPSEPGYVCANWWTATCVDVNCNAHCDGFVDAMRRDASLEHSRETMTPGTQRESDRSPIEYRTRHGDATAVN